MKIPPTRIDRFFNAIKRLNSVLLSLLLLALAAFLLYAWVNDRRAEPGDAAAAPKAVDTTAGEGEAVVLSLLPADRIESARTDMLRLTADAVRDRYSSPSSDMRNVLFVSDADSTGRWMFRDHANLVVALHELQERAIDTNELPTLAIYVEYRRIKPGSEAASGSGPVDIGLARPDGRDLTTVLRGVRILSRRVDGATLYLTFQRDAAVRIAEIPLADFLVTREREVARMPDAI